MAWFGHKPLSPGTKLAIVWKTKRGDTVAQIAANFCLNRATVYGVQARWKTGTLSFGVGGGRSPLNHERCMAVDSNGDRCGNFRQVGRKCCRYHQYPEYIDSMDNTPDLELNGILWRDLR